MGELWPVPDDHLVYWFSADVGVTVAEDGVSTWKDRSGNGADAFQDDGAVRPQLGTFAGHSDLPAIVFDGQDYLDLPEQSANFAAGVTFFCVALAAQETPGSALLELSNGKEIDDLTFLRFDQGFTYEVGNSVVHTNRGTFDLDVPRMVDVVHTADNLISLFIDEIDMAKTYLYDPFSVPADKTRFNNTIGLTKYEGAEPWPGQIAEILLYSRPLEPSERRQVETYLRKKWKCCTD